MTPPGITRPEMGSTVFAKAASVWSDPMPIGIVDGPPAELMLLVQPLSLKVVFPEAAAGLDVATLATTAPRALPPRSIAPAVAAPSRCLSGFNEMPPVGVSSVGSDEVVVLRLL